MSLLLVTTNYLNLINGYRHSSKGSLYTAMSKVLVFICPARGALMIFGRVHAPVTHID